MNMKIISIAFSRKMFPTIQGNLQLLLKVFLTVNHTRIQTAILEGGGGGEGEGCWGGQGVFFWATVSTGESYMNTVLLLLSGILSNTIFFMIYCKKRTFGHHGNGPSTKLIPIVSCFKRETSLFRHCDGRNYSPEIQIVLFYLVNFQVNALAQYWNLSGHLKLGVNVQHFAVQQEFKVVFAPLENK